MAAVVTEKSTMEDEAPLTPGCSSDEVVERFKEFLKTEDEDLLALFDSLVEKGHDNLDWSSSAFEIKTRNPGDALVESLNFSDITWFPGARREEAMVPDAPNDIQGDEDDPMTGGDDAGPSKGLDAGHAQVEVSAAPRAAFPRKQKRKFAPEVDEGVASTSRITAESIPAQFPKNKKQRGPAEELVEDEASSGRGGSRRQGRSRF